jgi:hypothetical protein
MAKKTIKKKSFSLSSASDRFSSKTKYKPDRFMDLGEAFQKATGLPGPAIGHLNVFLGHSDTGKTTALIKAAMWCQKNGILPVFIITEKKWNFRHAKMMGFDCEEVGPSDWEGFFIFSDDFDYIEQITDYCNEILDTQEKEDWRHDDGSPVDICFFWDSVGSVPCKMTYEGKGGKMHNASTLADKIGLGLHGRITGSRKEDSVHTNTMVFVNQPWVELPDNPFGQPKIKPKGGNAIYLASTLVFLFGNQKNSGIGKIKATKNGRSINYATRSKISILKNHVNGIGYQDGKIIVTPHDFIEDNKAAETKYKEKYADYWMDMFIQSGLDKVDENDKSFDTVDSVAISEEPEDDVQIEGIV